MTIDSTKRSSCAALSHEIGGLCEITSEVIKYSRANGATAAECVISEGIGQTVKVRCGDVETIKHNHNKRIGITVYLNFRRGHASTSDFSLSAVRATVDAAISIARSTARDQCAALPDELMLAREIPDLDLFHPWDLSIKEAIDIANTCESAAFSVDNGINNSEGASVSVQHSHGVFGNSLGFLAGYPRSLHWINCAVIAGSGVTMQRDAWHSSARRAADLDSPALVGRIAGRRAMSRLGAKRIPTMQAPVIFEAPVAASLLSHFVTAASGGNLYRKASFLLDTLGREIFSPLVNIGENPHLLRGLASGPYDGEGVGTRQRCVVQDGVLQGYFLSSYSARKLGLKTTGNSGHSFNLSLRPTTGDLSSLIRQMRRGLVVTELMGHGINLVNGDYSRGAAGYWVENGEIAHPVQEVTIAGNLKDIFRSILAVGSDVLYRGSNHCGSILVEKMSIGGK